MKDENWKKIQDFVQSKTFTFYKDHVNFFPKKISNFPQKQIVKTAQANLISVHTFYYTFKLIQQPYKSTTQLRLIEVTLNYQNYHLN